MIKITDKGDKVWVTFTFSAENAETVEISGAWNEWQSLPMKRKKNGDFSIRRRFDKGQSYEFGYTVNGQEWHCDNELGCVASPFGSDNSLLQL